MSPSVLDPDFKIDNTFRLVMLVRFDVRGYCSGRNEMQVVLDAMGLWESVSGPNLVTAGENQL